MASDQAHAQRVPSRAQVSIHQAQVEDSGMKQDDLERMAGRAVDAVLILLGMPVLVALAILIMACA